MYLCFLLFFILKNVSVDSIALSELFVKMRNELKDVMRPEMIGEIAKVPDLQVFKSPAVLPSNNCQNNDRPFNLDIQYGAGFEITLCVFLAFELEGGLSTDGLLDDIEEYITLEFDTGYVLKGAFSAGIKVTIESLSSPAQIEIDPIIAQLYMQSDVTGSADIGLFGASLSGNAELQGELSLGYCPSCNGTYPSNGFQRAREDSSFYFSRLIGYDMDLALSMFAGVPAGVEFDATARIGIEDDDVFDDVTPNITLPDVQFIKDSMRFSPQNAVSKFRKSVTSLILLHASKNHLLLLLYNRHAANGRCNACSSHHKQGIQHSNSTIGHLTQKGHWCCIYLQ